MSNSALEISLSSYRKVEEDYVSALRGKGLKFAERCSSEEEISRLKSKLRDRNVQFRNAGASLRYGWLSKACVECTGTGGSETFSTTFKCHRDCYFCFNYNLADYDKYVKEGCPWEQELSDAFAATDGKMAVMGLTGGEPLLNLDDSIRFLNRANDLFPDSHKRMYTSGDLLTEEGAERLRDAGLNEIRFSVKQDDPEDRRELVLSNMALAKRYIPDVVVEMPVLPGTEEVMKGWMRRFSEIGITGMNMLEFCFPFHSWAEFEKRGYLLKNPPFPVMYDYSYSGGLAVAGSEELCLKLMLFGIDEDLGFGLHYCSLENKHRSELRQLNERGRSIAPIFEFDEGDFFIKTAKVFGDDIERAKALLNDAGCADFYEDQEESSLAFAPRYADLFSETDMSVALASNVLDKDDEGHFLREVGLSVL